MRLREVCPGSISSESPQAAGETSMAGEGNAATSAHPVHHCSLVQAVAKEATLLLLLPQQAPWSSLQAKFA